ncbi:MAG: HD domain-containing phosphohydrolase [Planctomycetota bacterium]
MPVKTQPRARVYYTPASSDISAFAERLEQQGFECHAAASFMDVFESDILPRPGNFVDDDEHHERPVPILLLLDAADFMAAWENDQIRLKHLSRKFLGVIVLHDDQHEVLFSERMHEAVVDEVFRPVSESAVVRALRNAARLIRLEVEKAALRRELGRRTRVMRDINEIGIALSGERDLQKLLSRVLTNARLITGADGGSIYLVEGEQRDTLRFVWSQSESIDVPFQTFTMPLDTTSIAGCCCDLGQIINIEDAYQIPEDAPYRLNRRWDQSVGYRTKSILCVPMFNHEGETIGCIQLINRKREHGYKLRPPIPDDVERCVVPFDLENQALVTSFASQAAVALTNGILLRNIEELFEGLVKASVVAIESRDPVTSGHSERVTIMTVELAKAVSRCTTGPYAHVTYDDDQLRELRYAGLLHDLGKVAVREKVLTKAKKLYPWELDLVRLRFEYIRRQIEAQHMRSALDQVGNGSVPLEDLPAFLTSVEEAVSEDWGLLDSYLDSICQADEPTVLKEGTFENVKSLADLTYMDTKGEMHPYLTRAEIYSLSVPKGSLNPEERLEIESHVVHSYNFIKEIPWTKDLKDVPEIAATHHEKLDGSGYPRGLMANEIPLQGKMMAVADIFDALTAADRPYKRATPVEKALEILGFEVKDDHLDPELVRIFIEERVYESVIGRKVSTQRRDNNGNGR